jgi:hypothetical protein
MVIKLALRPLEARLGIEPGTLHGLLEALPAGEANAALTAALRGDLAPLRALLK